VKKNLKKLSIKAMYLAVLPFITGCQGQILSLASAAGSLFADGGGGGGGGPIIPPPGGDGGGGGIVGNVGHNPEPATMLLLGGGIIAMAYFKSKKK